MSTVENVSIEILPNEICDMVDNVKEIDIVNRKFQWSKSDEKPAESAKH